MEREIVLDGVTVNDDSDCYVIAEMGNNHQGNVETAITMVQVAKECGANAVKLQKRNNKVLFTKNLYDAPYDNENSFGKTYGEHREALEFGEAEYRVLMQYGKEIEITLFATAFDFDSADFLAKLDVPMFKIASGDLMNTPLLEHIAKMGKPIVLSSGGGTLEDVRRAYDTVMPINRRLVLLQCNATYPVQDYEDMNLKVISTYREEFSDVVIGLSDHESGIAMALVAYILGARVVEKHFTLNRAWRGTDHAFSLSPTGLKRLVRNLRRAKRALGDGIKRRLPAEEKPLFKMSKKIVAGRNLSQGHVLTQKDLDFKAPGDGLPPYEINNIIGRKLARDRRKDAEISFDCLE